MVIKHQKSRILTIMDLLGYSLKISCGDCRIYVKGEFTD